jgi:hypothetical protein
LLNYDPYPFLTVEPSPEWSGLSISKTDYALLSTGNKLKVAENFEVDKKTHAFTLSRNYTFDTSLDPFTLYEPVSIEPKVYNSFRVKHKNREYWKQSLNASVKKEEADKAKGLVNITVPIKFPKLVGSLIGEGGVGLRVNGYYKVTFDGRSQWDDKARVAAYKQSKFPSLNMEQQSSFKITGTIGSKIEVQVDQDSKRQTDLDNRIQIRFKGDEDDIVQTIEAGNTNLSLPNTQFVGYSSRVQGLFGIKATAKLGNLSATVITSQEKGNTEKSSFTAGAQQSTKYIRDYNYMKNTFFDIFRPEDGVILDVDKIIDYRLYISETDLEKTPQPGNAFVDPRNHEQYASENVTTTWLEVDRDAYWLYENEHYIEIRSLYLDGRSLAAYLEVLHGADTLRFGRIKDLAAGDSLELKLIKEIQPRDDHETFYYEWKNVYNLGARDIDEDGIEIKIYKGTVGQETQADATVDHVDDGTPYIQVLGLDRLDLNGNPNPDGLLDMVDNVIFLDRGYLFFPDTMPFINPALTDDKVPEIYSSKTNLQQYSKYYLAVQLRQRQTEYSLGKMNIIEGSEIVTLNGRRLVKDTDYTIYYDLGRIIFRTDDVLDPTANVSVDFEYQPFIAAEKKSLFGTRLDYVLSRDFKFGTTVLYKSEKSTDRKPRVGQEESKYLVWDADFSGSFELPLLTDMLDALPLIEATSASRVGLQGEIAQSVPNPNTRGDAYIDDFEGSREAMSLGVLRHAWTTCSPPEDNSGADNLTNPGFFTNIESNPRGRLIWYNPWNETPITQIWNRDVQERDNRTNTLVLRFDPDSAYGVESWGGVMRAINRGSWDQSQAQFLEIRMKRPSGAGQMRIYLGEISEDIDGDGSPDTEDRLYLNDILDDEEDVGLDTWTDAQERENLGINATDPSGDNWFYDDKNPDNYEGINGTEGNAIDPGRGYLPDTEDISGDNSLNKENSYYEFVLDFLNQSKYEVPNSENDSGWVTYRFPFDAPDDSTGDSLWQQTKYARLILTGFQSRATVEIAAMDIVSTSWLVQPLDTFGTTPALSMADEEEAKLEVAVVNTEENEAYFPPPDVEGYYDRVSETREKEQSLLLKYSNFTPGTRGIAERILYKSENYAGYRRLQMYVHSDKDLDSNAMFIFRFGTDKSNYYEFHTELHRNGAGLWDTRSYVNIDFDAITQVKDSLQTLREEITDTNFLSLGTYAIRGRPSVTNVIYFAVGVEYSDKAPPDKPISGEIWLDEMRVTDVRKDKGIAKRFNLSTTLSDVGSFSLSYNKTDAFFRQLTASDRNNLGSGTEKSSLSLSGSFSVDRLFPPQWGASLPVSYSWSKSESVPRLKSGSDIVISAEDRESETTRSYSESFSISNRFNRKTSNWLWNLTLNKFSSRFSYSSSRAKSPTTPHSESESYTASADYGLTPGKKAFKAFSWMKFIPLMPNAIVNTEVGYFLNQISFQGTVSRTQTMSKNNKGVGYSTYDRRLNGSASAAYNLFGSLPITYTFSTVRDLRDPETLKFSLNPKKFQLGVELSRRQSVTTKYDPKIVKFLGTSFSYKANYDETYDPKKTDGRFYVSNNSNWSVTGRFDGQAFFGKGGGTSKSPTPGKGGKGSGDFILFRPFLFVIRPITNRIDPVSLQYSQDNRFSSSGLVERPGLKFQFGLTQNPGVEVVQVAGSARRFDDSKSETYSAKTGVKFILGSKISAGWSRGKQNSSTQRQISETETFPDLSVSIGQLEKYRVVKWLFNSFSLNSGYTQKRDQSTNKNNGEREREGISRNWGPLLGFNVTWLKQIQSQGRYEYTTSITRTFTGSTSREQRNISKTFTLSHKYSFRSPTGFKMPIFGRIKFTSTMSLNIDISRRLTKQETVDAAGKVSPGNERTDLTISPRAGYSFSSNINGGMTMRWTDSEDKRTRTKSHVRQIGIWVEIRF